ncbi:MAG: hypothetical protein NT016_00915, partial [Candidatus Aenigmarchaeota archaeon]|nr:hypothetical protein [Candidatus Aenigmarchaeota archaeon]
FGAASQQDKMQMLGIANKVNYCITQGVTFTQVDVESMAEFKDPQIGIEDDEKLKAWKDKIDRLNIKLGFHGESASMGGRDTPIKLDSAIEDDYFRSHDRLMEVLKNAGRMGAKYYLLHSSESTPFIMLGKDFQPSVLVDFWGRPLAELINGEKGKAGDPDANWLWDWLVDQAIVWRELTRSGKLPRDAAKEEADEYAVRVNIQAGKVISESEKQEIRDQTMKQLTDLFFEHIRSRGLSYGPERFAYWIVAKWMEHYKDPLWEGIISEFKKRNDKIDPSFDSSAFRDSEEGMKVWVPAVAAKYLWGHFNPETCPTDGSRKGSDPKKWLEKYDMYFVIESPMAQAGMENLMRLSDPVHMCILADVLGYKFFRVAIDFEHVLSNYINPQEMIARMRDDDGNLVRVVHLGWPTPVIPAHMPIFVGSDQHRWIYQRLYELRQKGFTPGDDKDDNRWLIYERGGENIEQSIVAMRLIVKFLEKNVKPEELPLEFFGVEGANLLSEERQRTIIQQHARDPIEGLLVIPEEGHTLLGKAAIDKGVLEKWKKEELT